MSNIIKQAFNWTMDFPSPAAGLALGSSSLGVTWHLFFPKQTEWVLIVLTIFAILLLIPIIIKYIVKPTLLVKDLTHPVVGSVLPTITMTLMVLSHGVGLVDTLAGTIVWWVGLVIHAIFLISFIIARVINFKLSDMVPSWFVPPTGIAVACITLPHGLLYTTIGQIICVIGIVLYLIMIPTMIFRLVLGEIIPEGIRPTIAILAATPALLVASILTVFPHPDVVLTLCFQGVALLLALATYVMLIHLIRLPFAPSFSAFTFPLVICGAASLKLTHWASQTIPGFTNHEIMSWIAEIQLAIATVMFIYITVRYLRFISCKWHLAEYKG